jgi:hypothetical protein
VVFFLAAGLRELGAHGGRLRVPRLRVVQRLGAHFADVVDAHQARAVALFALVEFAVDRVRRRVRAQRGRHAADHAQRLIEADDQVVQGTDKTVR